MFSQTKTLVGCIPLPLHNPKKTGSWHFTRKQGLENEDYWHMIQSVVYIPYSGSRITMNGSQSGSLINSFPDLLLAFFLCSSVCVHYNTHKRRTVKKVGKPGNTYNTITWMMSGGQEVDIRKGRGDGCCLSTDSCEIKFSMLFERGSSVSMSTSHPPDIIHVIGVPRPSLIFFFSASMYYTERKP